MEEQASFQRVLTRYALERLLFRLSVSPHKESFVLKGAMLCAAWTAELFRTTRDLDLLSFGEPETERFVMIFRDRCVQPVEVDGLIFDSERIVAAPIRDGGNREAFGAAHRRMSPPPSSRSRSISVSATL